MQPMNALSRLPCDGILNAGDASELKPMKNVGLALSLSALFWFVDSSMHAQEAVDLPGMDWVLMHHNLSMAELNETWEDYAHEAVLVSQGAVLVEELKAGVTVLNSLSLQENRWQLDLLGGQQHVGETSVAFPTDMGRWVVVVPFDKLNSWSDRYVINAKAQLK